MPWRALVLQPDSVAHCPLRGRGHAPEPTQRRADEGARGSTVVDVVTRSVTDQHHALPYPLFLRTRLSGTCDYEAHSTVEDFVSVLICGIAILRPGRQAQQRLYSELPRGYQSQAPAQPKHLAQTI